MTTMWLEDFAGATDLLDRLIRQCRQSSALGVLPYALELRSALDMRNGRWQEGLASVTESIRLAEETRQANTYCVFFLGRLDAAMGARGDAERNLARADELADAYGIGCMPLYTGAGCGLLELSADIDAALHHLERVHDKLTWPVRACRTAMCFGEVLRRNRRRTEAREQLRAALDCFERLGAEPSSHDQSRT